MNIRHIKLGLVCVGFALLANCSLNRQNTNSNVTLDSTELISNSSFDEGEKKRIDLPIALSFSGNLLMPIIKAKDAFAEDPDIPDSKKTLNFYNIEVRKTDESLLISFFGLRSNDPDKLTEGGGTTRSKNVTYVYSLKEEKIVSRGFYK